MRILYVDDDSDSLRVYGTLLSQEGHDVQAASSGVEAIDVLVKDSRFDVVVTDYDMPGIKGDTTLSLIRARWPSLPVILISSHDDLERRARDIGAAAFLHKPCRAPALARALARIGRK